MNLVAILRDRAAMHPDRPALIDRWKGRDRTVTFRELMDRVERGSARLHELGLKRGQTILVLHPIAIELYEILLSAFHVGIRVMLVDPSVGKGFISTCCKRITPDAYFGSWKAQMLRYLEPAVKEVPIKIRSGAWFPGTSPWQRKLKGEPLIEVPEDEPALITFTSGSTGTPKAAVRTHGFLMAQHKVLSRALDFQDGEVDLVTLPVFVLANLASGLTSVLADLGGRVPGLADPASIRKQCQQNQVTRCAASPDFFASLLDKRKDTFDGLRKIYTGGGPVTPFFLADLKAIFPDASITAVFGSTEAEPIAHLDARETDIKTMIKTAAGNGLPAGHPVEEIKLRIIRDQWGQPLKSLPSTDFDAMELPPNVAGEVVVSGEHVLPGYLDGLGDEETKIHVDGNIWHRTGDAAWMDEKGSLWLLGRCSAKLPTSSIEGDKLPEGALNYPFAIEFALKLRFPNLPMAAVGWKGRRVLAIHGSLQDKANEALPREIKDFNLEEIIEVEGIPLDRRHNAKVDYGALTAMLEAKDSKS